jgi:hypothetical protein
MIRNACLAAIFMLPLISACGTTEPPPREAVNVTCDTGGRHGPSGILDYRCIDGDGEERLRPQSLHGVIEGAPIETGAEKG